MYSIKWNVALILTLLTIPLQCGLCSIAWIEGEPIKALVTTFVGLMNVLFASAIIHEIIEHKLSRGDQSDAKTQAKPSPGDGEDHQEPDLRGDHRDPQG